MSTLAIVFVFVLAAVLVECELLHRLSRLFGAQPTSRWWAAGLIGIWTLCGATAYVMQQWAEGAFFHTSPTPVVIAVIMLAIRMTIGVTCVWWVFRLSIGRAVGAYFSYLFLGSAIGLGATFALKAIVVDAFVISNNSMAPALLGSHYVASCPECHGKAIISTRSNDEYEEQLESRPGICSQCLNTSPFDSYPRARHRADRIFVGKWLNPQRWDLLTFRYPRDRKQIYIKRLVGLPGETVRIANGNVFINGIVVSPPALLEGIRYEADVNAWWNRNGLKEQEWSLGDDEYFVLGDFSLQSADSREWGPVAGADLVGVATVRYWPLRRLAIWK